MTSEGTGGAGAPAGPERPGGRETRDARGATGARRATLRCQFCLTLNRVDLGRAPERPRCGECGRPMLLDRPVPVAGEDLDRLVADAGVPVLVDFYADWCGPCKAMAPALDDLARESTGELIVAKLDTERHPEPAVRHGIRGIPTLILFRDGAEAARRVGFVSASELRALVSEAERP